MGDVVSLSSRREVWSLSYSSPDGLLCIRTSNHGRVSFVVGDKSVSLDFVDSVAMLSRVSEDMSFTLETACKTLR